ncbi:hypothetical protein LTS18_014486 [Coniosporium uncinatum]|uniref:Uncharacterized protein n=1 Tax=Coniosporium uncinatum TaxID=93489 RepID=A0ACC3DVA1_9PEZI|nr:hypothetical protein LTS18_014486 [Coniosporium uncinatum]
MASTASSPDPPKGADNLHVDQSKDPQDVHLHSTSLHQKAANVHADHPNDPQYVAELNELLLATLSTPPGTSHPIVLDPPALIDHAIPEASDEVPIAETPSFELGKTKDHSVSKRFEQVVEILLILVAIVFIVLCALIAAVNRQVVEANALGHRLEIVLRFIPTVFPIVFAALAGDSLKKIALLLAERGSRLRTLELLVSCRTLATTIKSLYQLRKFSALTISILALWVLSPLGSQASLRTLLEKPSYITDIRTMSYLDTSLNTSRNSIFTSGDMGILGLAPPNMYNALLLLPTQAKLSPQDEWRNIRIPRLESFEKRVT